MIIYLDESGDLGFSHGKKASSRFFTISVLVCHSVQTSRQIDLAVRRTLKNKINAKRKTAYIEELKGSHTSLETKKYFLAHLPVSEWGVFAISLDKSRVFDTLSTKDGKKKLYNFLTRLLLERVAKKYPSEQVVNLIVDQSKDGEDRKDFNAYIRSNLETAFPLEAQIYISHENSQNKKGLQAVDLFCWGIQRKENTGDRTWYGCFERHIMGHIHYLYGRE